MLALRVIVTILAALFIFPAYSQTGSSNHVHPDGADVIDGAAHPELIPAISA